MSFPAVFSLVSVLRSRRIASIASGLLLALALTALAQPPGRQEEHRPTNLKVLDSTMTHGQVIGVMRGFSQALGVRGEHCHAAPKPGERETDFASDENKLKETAREMIKMNKRINNDFLAHLPATSDTFKVSVQCVTCHHGQPVPVSLEDLLRRARNQGGMAAVDSTYRARRTDFYGSFTYDFGDQVLALIALDLFDQNTSDAAALLKLNKEFNPDSYLNEYAFGKVYEARADTAAAIAAFKRTLELNPEMRPARRELQELGEKR